MNPRPLVFVWAVVESSLLALGEAVPIAILLLAAIHAIPNVNLINVFLRQVFEVVCALRMQPALVRAEFLSNFAGHHEFLLDLTSANAIQSKDALAKTTHHTIDLDSLRGRLLGFQLKRVLIGLHHERVSLAESDDIILLILLFVCFKERCDNDLILVEWILHVHQEVDGWQSLQLVLDHLLKLHFITEHSLQEGLGICDQRRIHLVAFLGGERFELNFMPREIIS